MVESSQWERKHDPRVGFIQFAVGVSIVLIVATVAGLFHSSWRKSKDWELAESKLDTTLAESMDASDATATY
jgi:hypothetical protein